MVSDAILVRLPLMCIHLWIVSVKKMYRGSISLLCSSSHSFLVTERTVWKLLGKTFSITRRLFLQKSDARVPCEGNIKLSLCLESTFQINRLCKTTFASDRQNARQVAAYKLFCHRIKGTLIPKCMQGEMHGVWNMLGQGRNRRSSCSGHPCDVVAWCGAQGISLVSPSEPRSYHRCRPLN